MVRRFLWKVVRTWKSFTYWTAESRWRILCCTGIQPFQGSGAGNSLNGPEGCRRQGLHCFRYGPALGLFHCCMPCSPPLNGWEQPIPFVGNPQGHERKLVYTGYNHRYFSSLVACVQLAGKQHQRNLRNSCLVQKCRPPSGRKNNTGAVHTKSALSLFPPKKFR